MATVEYCIQELRNLRVITFGGEEGRPEFPAAIEVAGEPFKPTERFWKSFFHRYGLTSRVFKYFRYSEVLSRVVAANPDDRMRFCIDRRARVSDPDNGGVHTNGTLLAVSNPRKPLITYDQTMELTRRYGDGDVSCRGGIVTSRHAPRSGEHGFQIGPDQFRNRFIVQVPIDGLGQPRIYLSLLRQICTNGAVGYSRAFRSDIRIGEDAVYTLERALSQFDHDEGFATLRHRFDSAQKSWASVHETLRLRKTLERVHLGSAEQDPASRRWPAELNRVAGDLNAIYGLANLDSLSVKRQRVLPAKCRVYDLINFASEVATHHAPPESQIRLQAFIGTIISDEYDLEGTAERVPEFNDLFLNLN